MGTHAVVLGASMAGLLSARVLAEHYDRVTVVERDELPTSVQHRRGMPQSRHLHGLLAGGLAALDELFPGFGGEVAEAGAVTGDVLADAQWILSGHLLRQARIGQGVLCSRPFLEAQVRTRVRALAPVRFLERCDITGLAITVDGRTVTGARIAAYGGAEQTVTADLVVDATGRGSRTPVWLEQLGYPRPVEERVRIGLGYATRTFRLREDALNGDVFLVVGGVPGWHRMGAVAAQEGGRRRHARRALRRPSTDGPARVPRVRPEPGPPRGRRRPRRCRTARRRGKVPVPGQYPAAVRAAARVPEPAAGHRRRALLVQPRLRAGHERGREAGRGAAQAAGAAPDAGSAALVPHGREGRRRSLADRRRRRPAFPEVEGKRTAQIRMVNAYLPRLHAAAATDVHLARAFVRVMSLVERPEGLLRPDRALRVATGRLRRRPEPGRSAVTELA